MNYARTLPGWEALLIFVALLLLSVGSVFYLSRVDTPFSWWLLVLIPAVPLFLYVMHKPQIGFYLSVLSFMLDSQTIPGPMNLSVSNVLLVVTLVAVCIKRVLSRRGPDDPQFGRVDKPSLLLGGCLLVAAILSLFVAQFPEVVLRMMVTLVGGLTVLYLTQVLSPDFLHLVRIVKFYVWGAVVCAGLGVLQSVLAGLGVLSWGINYSEVGRFSLPLPRVTSTWLDPNIFGLFLLPAVFYAFAVLTGRIARFLVIAVLLSGLALSYSRTAWTSAVIAGLIYGGTRFLSKKSSSLESPSRTALRAYLAVLVPLGVALIVWRTGIWEWLIDLNRESVELRVDLNLVAWRYFQSSPVFGIGPGNFWESLNTLSHNSFLAVLVEYGLLGGLAWTLILGLTAWRAMKIIFGRVNPVMQRLMLCSVCSFVGLLVGGLAIEIQNAKFVWLTVAIITTLSMLATRDPFLLAPGGRQTRLNAKN